MAAREQFMGVVLFAMYLGINLSALLLAAQSQQREVPSQQHGSDALRGAQVHHVHHCYLWLEQVSGSGVNVVINTLFGMPDVIRVAMPSPWPHPEQHHLHPFHLDAVSFQITYQLKIVAALIASRILLRKKFRPRAGFRSVAHCRRYPRAAFAQRQQ